MAKTWEWRMRSWVGTRSQRGLADARVTLAAGVGAGRGTISQRGFWAWATTSHPGVVILIGSAWGRGLAVARAAPGRGGRGGGGPRVQVKEAAGWALANSSRKAAGRELAIDPAQQTLPLLEQELGLAGSCGRRNGSVGLIKFAISIASNIFLDRGACS